MYRFIKIEGTYMQTLDIFKGNETALITIFATCLGVFLTAGINLFQRAKNYKN